LGQPQTQVALAEYAVLTGIDSQEVDVVEVADTDAPPRVAVRLVLERRAQRRRRRVALGFVEQLDAVAVGVQEAVGAAVTEVALEPFALDPAGLHRRDPSLERLR